MFFGSWVRVLKLSWQLMLPSQVDSRKSYCCDGGVIRVVASFSRVKLLKIVVIEVIYFNDCVVLISPDRSEPATLGAEIRELIATSAKQNAAKGPIIVTVNSAERVLLTGDELETYIRLKEEDHRRLEELEHRHLREKELTTLIGGGTDESGLPIRLDNGEDLDADTSDESDDGSEFEVDVNGDHEAYVPEEASLAVGKKRRQKDRSIQNGTKKTKSIGRIAQYATPRFQMFETRELRQLPDCMDEYGLDNSDLNFTEIVTSTTLVPKYGKVHRGKDVVEAKGTLAVTSQGVTEEMLHGDEDDEIDPNAPPSKVVSTPTRVQLTCTFKEIAPAAWGRLDFKGVKTLINKCAPKHLILLHGTNNISHSSASGHIRGLSHVNKVVEYASKSIGASRVFAPEVNQIVHLQVSDVVIIYISHFQLLTLFLLDTYGTISSYCIRTQPCQR
jgi:hypothetical protein